MLSDPGPSDPPSRVGAAVGAYEIVREIGRGGMGIVYEARHTTLGSRAAIKLLNRPGGAASAELEAVLREARAASRTRHPGVVHVFDAGRLDDGTPYILMEYVEGELLRHRLLRLGALPHQDATRTLRQLASTLASVHAGGIVHRDLKPENVVLVPDDAAEGGERAKLLDFGIARAPRPDEAPVTEPVPPSLSIAGTPAYMSPEQCSAAAVTSASDVYALGILFCEMLTGQAPFRGDPPTVLRKHLYAALDDEVIERIPSSARSLIERMLAKAPASRPSAAEIAAAFAPTLSSPRLTAAPTTFDLVTTTLTSLASHLPARRTWRWGALVALAFVVGTLVGVRAAKRGGSHPALRGMVYFEGGTFTMGRTAAEADAECAALGARCRRDVLEREQPPRRVELRPFYLDVNEVTKGEYYRWVRNRALDVEDVEGTDAPRFVKDVTTGLVLLDFDVGCNWLASAGGHSVSLLANQEDEPAVGITWDGAREYCASNGKRLPTEAEWELAARGKTSRAYPWGDAPPTCEGAVYGRIDAFPCDATHGSDAGLAPIGGSPRDWSPEGVHDLFGNASEWVEDAFLAPYLPDCGACKDPVVEPPAAAPGDTRVTRGNSWMLYNFGTTSARGRWRRDSATMGLGFRCAAEVR